MSDSNGLAFWHVWINPKEQNFRKIRTIQKPALPKSTWIIKTFSAVRFFVIWSSVITPGGKTQ